VRPRITRLTVKGRRVSVAVAGPSGARVSSALSVMWRGHYVRDRFLRSSSNFAYVRVPRGRYRLRVRVGSVTLTRYLVVR
jgi:FtsP/CotA-like multicopper oxidase with cupredoxin domain